MPDSVVDELMKLGLGRGFSTAAAAAKHLIRQGLQKWKEDDASQQEKLRRTKLIDLDSREKELKKREAEIKKKEEALNGGKVNE
jgi:ribosomal protein S9